MLIGDNRGTCDTEGGGAALVFYFIGKIHKLRPSGVKVKLNSKVQEVVSTSEITTRIRNSIGADTFSGGAREKRVGDRYVGRLSRRGPFAGYTVFDDLSDSQVS